MLLFPTQSKGVPLEGKGKMGCGSLTEKDKKNNYINCGGEERDPKWRLIEGTYINMSLHAFPHQGINLPGRAIYSPSLLLSFRSATTTCAWEDWMILKSSITLNVVTTGVAVKQCQLEGCVSLAGFN